MDKSERWPAYRMAATLSVKCKEEGDGWTCTTNEYTIGVKKSTASPPQSPSLSSASSSTDGLDVQPVPLPPPRATNISASSPWKYVQQSFEASAAAARENARAKPVESQAIEAFLQAAKKKPLQVLAIKDKYDEFHSAVRGDGYCLIHAILLGYLAVKEGYDSKNETARQFHRDFREAMIHQILESGIYDDDAKTTLSDELNLNNNVNEVTIAEPVTYSAATYLESNIFYYNTENKGQTSLSPVGEDYDNSKPSIYIVTNGAHFNLLLRELPSPENLNFYDYFDFSMKEGGSPTPKPVPGDEFIRSNLVLTDDPSIFPSTVKEWAERLPP